MLNTSSGIVPLRMVISLQNRKIIGTGNTATVYELPSGKVLKLFHKGYPKDSVEREFKNAKVIEKMNFLKPKAHETIMVDDQWGIIYDYVQGESLDEWVLKTGKIEECSLHMAKLHKETLNNRFDKGPSYKDILRNFIMKAQRTVPEDIDKALKKLNTLPEGNVLCHGDFHPGNIIISHGKSIILDFMNLCRGDYLFDVARTVYLVEFTPVSEDVENKEMFLKLKIALTDSYIKEMNVTRGMIQDFLEVIDIARLGECPEESAQIKCTQS